MANSAIVGTLRALLSADTAEFATAMKKAGDAADQAGRDMTKASASFEAAGGRLASVTRLVRDFSGSLERRSAEEFAAAIEKIGGAARLSETELRRAQGVFADYTSKARALGQEVPAHIAKVSTEIEKLSSVSTRNVGIIDQIRGAFSNLGPSILSAAGGFATALISVEALTQGLRASIQFLKDSVTAYAEAEKAQRKMVAALEAQGQATPQTIAAYKALADQFQKTTVFSDDLITEMESLLIQVGNVMPNEMEAALTAVTNLASGLGIDLRSATMLVAKSFEDNFTALGRAGVIIDQTRAKAEGMTYVLGQIQERFGGQAQADLRTFSGQMEQTGNQFNNLQEAIGGVILKSTAFQIAFAVLRAEIEKVEKEITFIVQTLTLLGKMPGPVGASFRVLIGDLNATSTGIKQITAAATEWQGPIQAVTDKTVKATKVVRENTKAVDEAEKAYRDWAMTITGQKLEQELLTLETRLQRLTKEGGLNAKSMAAIADEAENLRKKGAVLTPNLQSLVNQFVGLSKSVLSATVALPLFADAIALSGDEIRALAKDFQDINKKIEDFNKIITTTPTLPKIQGGVSGEDLRKAQAAIETFGEQATSAFLTVGQAFIQMGHAIGGESGRIISQIGGIAEGIGRLASGDVIGGIAQLVSTLATIRTAWRNVARDTQDAFATTELGFANLAALNQHLRDLGAIDLVNAGDRAQRKDDEKATRRWMEDVRKFLAEQDRLAQELSKHLSDAFGKLGGAAADFAGKAPQALQPFIDELLRMNGLTQEQKDLLSSLAGAPEWKQLQGIAEKYGIELGALGKNFQDARIGDTALQYARDFNTLKEAGGDVNGLLIGMQEEVQALVKDALIFGTEMPEAMRPVLQGLLDMGLLTDENGKKLENLDRFKFSGAFEDIFKDMKGVLIEIRDLLRDGLPKAAGEGAQGIKDKLKDPIEIPIKWSWRGWEGQDPSTMAPPSGFTAPSAQHGGITKQDGLVMLHQNEMILPLDQLNDQNMQPRIDNRLYIDGREVTKSVVVHLREMARLKGTRPI